LSKWKEYDKPTAEEIAQAELTAEKLTQPEEKKEIRLVRGGRKKEKGYGVTNLPPLIGCTKDQSDLIRHLIGLKFAGYTQTRAFELADVTAGRAVALMQNHDDAFDEATYELLDRCKKSYLSNLLMLRSALSEQGPQAVRVLGAVMNDKKASAAARVNAAKIVLKMVNVDGSVGNTGEGDSKDYLTVLKDYRAKIESSSVIDAEDVEVLSDEGTDQTECSSRVC
jgi:hypothetical protein